MSASDQSDPLGYSAFICHADEDRERAEEVCATLEERGLTCWIASRDVRAGAEYGAQIIRGIERSRCLVLVMSSSANASPHVRNEVERAVSKRKPVFPFRVEDVLPSPALELFVSSTHWIDAFTGRMVDHIDTLARELADEKVLAEATELTGGIARRRERRRWMRNAALAAGVILAVVVGGFLSRGLRRETPAQAGDGSVILAGPTTVRSIDAFQAMAKSLGVDLANLKSSDFRATIHPDRDIPGGHVLRISASEGIQRLLQQTEMWYTLPGGAEQRCFTWSVNLYPAQTPRPPKSGDVTLRFQTYVERSPSAKPLTFGPFTVPLREGPPVSGIGSLVQNTPGPAQAEMARGVQESQRRTVDYHLTLARQGLPKSPKKPDATLAGLKEAFASTASTAVVARRITIAPALDKELGFADGDAPADTTPFPGMTDPRTAVLMNDRARRRRWGTASGALSSNGLGGYHLGDTPVVVCIPRDPVTAQTPKANLTPWAAVREVRVGTARERLHAEPVSVTLVDVHKGRVPLSPWGHFAWRAELPGDAERVFAQFVYADGETSEIFEVPVEDLELK